MMPGAKDDAAPAAEQENPDLFDYEQIRNYLGFVFGAARRHPLIAIGLLILTMAATVGGLKILPRTYHVETRLLAQRNQTIAALSNPGRSLGWDDVPLRAATETVLRHDNLVSLVKQTDLVKRWPQTRAPLLAFKDRTMESLRGPINAEDQLAGLVGYLGAQLKVAVGDGTVSISLDWPDAETAFMLVEAAQQSFLEARHVAEISTVSEAISLLEAHALRLRTQIDGAVEQISRANDSKPQEKTVRTRAVRPTRSTRARDPGLNPEIAQLQVMLEGKRRAIRDLEEFHGKQLSELQARLAEQKSIYSDLHPAVIEIQQRIDALERQQPTQLTTLRQEERDLENELSLRGAAVPKDQNADSRSFLGPLPAHILKLEREAREMESDDPVVEHAKSELQFAMTKYGALLDRIDSAKMELDTSRAAFKYRYSIIAPAEKPHDPVKPKPASVLTAAFVAGIALALLGATWADIRRGRVVERWQVVRQLQLDILGEARMP
ncbi:MAG TPA: hypothetical protein VFE90_11845 [Myxococcales bacterium]|nr:hypothetical protein [Myxococcales bacterium]